MTNTTTTKTDETVLYDAYRLLIKELFIVKSSVGTFRVIGLNTKKLSGAGTDFLNFSKLQSQRMFVIGIENIFELGPKKNGEGLCSVRGLLSLAQEVGLKNSQALRDFLRKYKVDETDIWYEDVASVLEHVRPIVRECMKYTSNIRNNRVAHLSQSGVDPDYQLPSVGLCEQIIEFIQDFCDFISVGFLGGGIPAQADDRIERSIHNLLIEIGVDACFDFPDPKISITEALDSRTKLV